MAKTIVFQPEVEEFLKKHKVKTRFINNIIQDGTFNISTTSKKRLQVLTTFSLDEVICSAFTWCETTEGVSFWYNLGLLAIEQHELNKSKLC